MPAAKPSKKTHRILIVDDHPILRQGIAQLLSLEPDLSVCAEAEDAATAFDLVARLKPDLVLADITLPGRNGIELIKDIRSAHPSVPVLILSMHDEALYAERVLRAGGRGYIMKGEGGRKLIDAIRQVLRGQIYVSSQISARVLESLSGRSPQHPDSPTQKLSDREFEVFGLIGQGHTTRTIAAQLGISIKTAEVHRLNIKKKLGAKTAPELVRMAVRWIESGETRL